MGSVVAGTKEKWIVVFQRDSMVFFTKGMVYECIITINGKTYSGFGNTKWDALKSAYGE